MYARQKNTFRLWGFRYSKVNFDSFIVFSDLENPPREFFWESLETVFRVPWADQKFLTQKSPKNHDFSWNDKISCTEKKNLQTLHTSHPWTSDDDLAYTMASATSKCTGKNYLSQIECWNLENEAKTTRKVVNLSVNFVVPTSCKLSAYYSLSLSRISSTSHGM